MAQQKFKGVSANQEVDARQLRPDTRRMSVKAREFFQTTDGVIAMMMSVPVLALISIKVPFSAELLLLAMWFFYKMYVDPGHNNPKRKGGKILKYDFPFRVPQFARRFDGSMTGNRLGTGITFLGKEISTKLEIWSGDSDLRTHMLCLGTTGSGKTEFLLGLVYNALVQNSGFIYTDGKGAVDLWNNVYRLARYIGRECDLVLINFLTSGRDFLDKQKDRTTNTMNPFALGSSGMLIELIIALMDDSGGGGDMWKGRAIAFVAGLTRTLCFLRDRGYLLLDAGKFMEYFELPVIEKLVWDKTITENGHEIKIDDPIFEKVLAPLRTFVLTLPGYKREVKGNQEQKTTEQFGFITMQLTRLFGDLGYTYGYIFQTALGEVDMYDVVINRRILVVLLPSLERAPDSLKMLGKLIVGAIKQMMAGCLGNRVEGAVREIVDARPTNAKVPFYVVLDEYGYYAVLGFAVAPAQARSLGFPQPLYSAVRLADGSVKRMGEVEVGDQVLLPDGRSARVAQVLEQGKLPVSRLHLAGGIAIDAANVHHWPARIGAAQNKLMTTMELAHAIADGKYVELSRIDANGALEWVELESVKWRGIEETRCLVVDDPLHCYLSDHDVVTHNCITFAAQDFSSLQKASKEEADATWENTNVRIAGRMTGGKGAETFKRLADVADTASVHEVSRKEHDVGTVIEGYRTIRDTSIVKAERLEFGDLAAQENGEFTVLIGKKNKDGSGGVRIIRARTFYTQVDERPREIRVNHFLKVEPPRSGSGDQEIEVIEALEKSLTAMLADGDIKKIFPNNPIDMVKPGKPTPLLQMAMYMRNAQQVQKLSLGEAIRVALVCMDRESEVQQAQSIKKLQEAQKRAAESAASQELAESVAVVVDAPVGDVPALPDDEYAIPDITMDDDYQIKATPDGLPDGQLVVDGGVEAPKSDADKKDEGKAGAAGTGAGSSSSTSAGMALDLSPSVPTDLDGGDDGEYAIPDIPDIPETAAPMQLSASSAAPPTVGSAIKNFLDDDDDEFAIPEIVEVNAAVQQPSVQAAAAPVQVSPLTFRKLGAAGDVEPTEQTIYLESSITELDVLLGAKNDVLEIKRDAQEAVQKLEAATAYVVGVKPEKATLEGVDNSIKALLYAAENGANDFS